MRRSRGFTLLELLVVIGIMGLLGTTAVGGYRAMVRSMEERGVMQNVNTFVRAAYQRAQIDRQPTIVYFWNETLRSRTNDDLEQVVGRAVAVRRCGRISRKEGTVLIDEFADLDKTYMTSDEEDQQNGGGGGNSKEVVDLYAVDKLSASGFQRSTVRQQVVLRNDTVQFLGGTKTDESDDANEIPGFGFVLEDANGVDWKQGMAYGFEFQRLELPIGYVFGSSFSSDVGNPVTEAGRLVFDAGVNRNSGLNEGGVVGGQATIPVSALRQTGATLSAVKIADSDRPDRKM